MSNLTDNLPYNEVAEAIYQVRLPLPFALNHVHSYLLRDGVDWAIVDAGLHWPESVAVWQRTFAALAIAPRRVRQIILTHVHPDHFGMAGALQKLTGAPILLSSRELEAAQRLWRDNLWGSPAMLPYFQAAGVDPKLGEKMSQQTGQLRQMAQPYPQELHILEPGATIPMGGRHFQAIHAPGHSDGQLIFYAAEDRLLLCGDQVLLKITPNIGLWPNTEPDPLGRFLASLQTLAQRDVQLALPGHGRLITDWPGRLHELQAHHQLRLDKMYAAVADGATALQVTERVFDIAHFTDHEMRFAVAETLAHLEHLVLQGRVTQLEDKVRHYQPT